jgi:hypothetical protein
MKGANLGQVALWASKWARGLLELLAKDCFFYALETGLCERKFTHVTTVFLVGIGPQSFSTVRTDTALA